jgi:phage tail protein X
MSSNRTTIEGETWSTIAWDEYRSLDYITTLIDANPSVPIEPVLPAGTRLIIPIIEKSTVVKTAAWK